jgi:hypothetical protein
MEDFGKMGVHFSGTIINISRWMYSCNGIITKSVRTISRGAIIICSVCYPTTTGPTQGVVVLIMATL